MPGWPCPPASSPKDWPEKRGRWVVGAAVVVLAAASLVLLGAPTAAWQAAPAAAAQAVSPSTTLQARVDMLVAEALGKAVPARRAMARRVVDAPTLERPFVFLHQRKSGGSALRTMIANASKARGLSFFVPCKEPRKCMIWEPPQLQSKANYSVFGGHFNWAGVESGLTYKPRANLHPAEPQFDCLTVFREPTERVRSCWNFRFIQSGGIPKTQKPPMLSAFPAKDLRKALNDARSAYGYGCNNEPLRLLAGAEAEPVVNLLTSNPRGRASQAVVDAQGWSIDAPGVMARTLDHMQQCVVGVLERCADTQEAVEFFQPWLRGWYDCDYRENEAKVKPAPIPPASKKVIERSNALEYLLYDVANKMLDAQLLVAREKRGRHDHNHHGTIGRRMNNSG